MSTKGTLTLTVTAFRPWDAQPPAGGKNCCTATASLEANDNKIQLEDGNTTDFQVVIYKHGSNTELEFYIQPMEGGTDGFSQFIPIGIAFKETDTTNSDPVGTDEFPETTIEFDNDGNRRMTVEVSSVNVDLSWNFYIVIQAIQSRDETTDPGPVSTAIGIIDPRVRGSAGDPP
jgi:hypothetical protein